ncbi:MAG TPA: L-2-amino-thiazoline-4-carboxylic acid hydrolase [Ohtaekwangia sp.]|nr:L-2-amino-thiazoline-4-carboxylic acid hydrolase [Ohtaekwangia sp.]
MKNYKKSFRTVLRHCYPEEAGSLLSLINHRFAEISDDVRFARMSNNPMDRRMDAAGYFLAMMMVLDKEGASFERIREISLQVAHHYVRPRNSIEAWFKRLPVKLMGNPFMNIFLKKLDRRIGQKAYSEGFVARIITDPQDTYGLGYGVDILECGICKLYAKYDYKKFATILCEVDHITSALAGLQIIRSGTIAHGAVKCDFRYKKLSQ